MPDQTAKELVQPPNSQGEVTAIKGRNRRFHCDCGPNKIGSDRYFSIRQTEPRQPTGLQESVLIHPLTDIGSRSI